VFTNLTRDHLDFRSDMESYFRPEAAFEPENAAASRPPSSIPTAPTGKRLKYDVTCPVLRVGFSKPAEIYVLEHENRADGTSLTSLLPAENPV
jgi:UDP-N-acetylmuramyl tripeptide synthase